LKAGSRRKNRETRKTRQLRSHIQVEEKARSWKRGGKIRAGKVFQVENGKQARTTIEYKRTR